MGIMKGFAVISNASYCLGSNAAATDRLLKERSLVLQDFWGVFSILIFGVLLILA